MKLYSFPGSCSTSVHVSLLEAGLDFEHVVVDLRGPRSLPDGRFLKDINPKNTVPVLEFDNGEILTEAPAILTYIADLVPEKQLIPSFGSMDRVRFVELFSFLSVDVYKSFRIYRMTFGFESSHNEIKARMIGYFEYLDSIFAQNKYLMGDNFTVLDPYLMNVLVGAPKYFDYDLSAYKNIQRFVADMMARDAVKTAYEFVDDYIGGSFKRAGADKV